jgi:N-acetylglucosamine kinase-like BadF-type ATPase
MPDHGGMPVSEPQPGHAPRPLHVLVGVDAGATKTIALAAAPDGERLGRAETEGANPKRHGLNVAADRIAAVAVSASAHAVGPATGAAPALVFVAGAGIDRPEHARALEDELAGRLPGTRILVVNDTLAVLKAGTPDAVGLVVPVSTGGNVIGRAADGRVTDRGHGIFGGGYVLGALAARAARRGASGAAPPAGPPSVGRVGPELAGQIAAAQLAWRGRRPAPEAARLGSAVVAAAQAGDPYPARMVGRWCARVEAGVREEVERLGLGPSPVVILYGGLLDVSPWLAARLREAVLRGAPGARTRGLDGEPVDGAVLLARDAWAGRPVGWDFTARR